MEDMESRNTHKVYEKDKIGEVQIADEVILIFTSKTLNPVMFSMALFTFSWTFSDTSGILYPYFDTRGSSYDSSSGSF